MSDHHDFGLDHRKEFDEVFISDAYVHIERMGNRCFWIGIEPPSGSSLPRITIFTGVGDGKWFFRIEEDATDGLHFLIEKPAKYQRRSDPADSSAPAAR